MGIGIMIVTFVLHAKKKLTVNLAVTWELLGIAAILSGAVPRFSGWSSRIGLGSLVVLLDRKSTRLNSSHRHTSRMPSSA